MANEPIEHAKAWLLHKKPKGDTSLQLTFFTQASGLLRCTYRGARKKRQAIAQPFTPYWLALDVKRDWHYVRHLEPAGATLEFQGQSLFCALYVNELLYYSLLPMAAHSDLYLSYTATLTGLAQVSHRLEIEQLLRRFELDLLSECGYALDFTHEAGSGRAIEAECFYSYQSDTGFVLSAQGIKGSLLRAASHIQQDPLVLKMLKPVLRQAVDTLLNGRELKSRQLILQAKGG